MKSLNEIVNRVKKLCMKVYLQKDWEIQLSCSDTMTHQEIVLGTELKKPSKRRVTWRKRVNIIKTKGHTETSSYLPGHANAGGTE